MMLKMWNQQVRSRFSHNTLHGHFLREGIRLRWLDLKRPPSCDQTAIAEKNVTAPVCEGVPMLLWKTWLLWLWA